MASPKKCSRKPKGPYRGDWSGEASGWRVRILAWKQASHFPSVDVAPCVSSGRKDRPVWCRKVLKNWPSAGFRSWTHTTKPADLCYEIHAGEDVHDGVTFERFFEACGKHNRLKMLFYQAILYCNNWIICNWLTTITSSSKCSMWRMRKYNPNGRSGVYGGTRWIDRPGRFRSLGDGQVNFKAIFSKLARVQLWGLEAVLR